MPMSVCLFVTLRKARRAFFAKYIGQYRLLLCESLRLFAKYIGQYRLSVCPSVCYFAKVNDFSQSILVSTVCLSVCKSVCLSVCHASYRPQFCTDQDYFFTVDSAYPANFTFFFCKYRPKVKVKVTKNHENNRFCVT